MNNNNFLFRLGYQIAHYKNENPTKKIRCVILLPTLGKAARYVAAGINWGRVNHEVSDVDNLHLFNGKTVGSAYVSDYYGFREGILGTDEEGRPIISFKLGPTTKTTCVLSGLSIASCHPIDKNAEDIRILPARKNAFEKFPLDPNKLFLWGGENKSIYKNIIEKPESFTKTCKSKGNRQDTVFGSLTSHADRTKNYLLCLEEEKAANAILRETSPDYVIISKSLMQVYESVKYSKENHSVVHIIGKTDFRRELNGFFEPLCDILKTKKDQQLALENLGIENEDYEKLKDIQICIYSEL